MNELYIFLAYKSENDYPLKPFHKKLFYDFNKMKEHSSKHSFGHKHDKCYPKYISTYSKLKL